MPDTLFEAYGRTAFVAATPKGRLVLRVGQRSVELDDLLADHGLRRGRTSAFNSGSRLQPAEANAARQRELGRVVTARGFASYPGEGIEDDGRWPPEASLLILGIGRTEATQLGQEFGQLAVVYGELRQEAEVIICDRRREE